MKTQTRRLSFARERAAYAHPCVRVLDARKRMNKMLRKLLFCSALHKIRQPWFYVSNCGKWRIE